MNSNSLEWVTQSNLPSSWAVKKLTSTYRSRILAPPNKRTIGHYWRAIMLSSIAEIIRDLLIFVVVMAALLITLVVVISKMPDSNPLKRLLSALSYHLGQPWRQEQSPSRWSPYPVSTP